MSRKRAREQPQTSSSHGPRDSGVAAHDDALALLTELLMGQDAVAAAKAEGLPLIRSGTNATGYKHVYADSRSRGKPFKLQIDGKYHGNFSTAEAAALGYSRHLGPEAARAEAAAAQVVEAREMVRFDMTAADALAAAEAEELPLIPSRSNASGWKGVSINKKKAKPFICKVNDKYQGMFATAEEAALCYSRAIGREAAESEAVAFAQVDMTAQEALAVADAMGLPLVRAANETGYKFVKRDPSCTSRPFQLQIERKSLGYFATPEAAALWYSRHIGRAAAEREAARAARVDLTVDEALAAAEAEGLTLVRTAHPSGFRAVQIDSSNTLSRPYMLQIGGRTVAYYATPEEAALNYARRIGREEAEAQAAQAAAALARARAYKA